MSVENMNSTLTPQVKPSEMESLALKALQENHARAVEAAKASAQQSWEQELNAAGIRFAWSGEGQKFYYNCGTIQRLKSLHDTLVAGSMDPTIVVHLDDCGILYYTPVDPGYSDAPIGAVVC